MKKKVFIIYSSAEWSDEPYLNVHFYARGAAALGYRVIFIESIGLRNPQIKKSRSDKLRIVKRLLKLLFMPLQKKGNTFVLTPLYYPIKRLNLIFRSILNFQLFLLCDLYERVHWVFLPTFKELMQPSPKDTVIYHAVDNYSANPGVNKEEIEGLERSIIKRANYVFCTSQPLKEKLERHDKRVILLSNRVVDCNLKRSGSFKGLKIKHPAMVYTGNIASYKLDFTLIQNIVEKNPEINFYFIGTHNKGEIDTKIPFIRFENVHFLKEVPHSQLLNILTQFNGGFMPYRLSNSTRYSYPMKYMEFLLAGIPVYSTILPSMKNEKYLIPLNPLKKITLNPPIFTKNELIAYAKSHCWRTRIKKVLELIEEGK